MRVVCPVFMVAALLWGAGLAFAAPPSIVVTPTNWAPPTINSTWLAGGVIGSVAGSAGSNLTSPYQTPSYVVTCAINPRNNAGTCTVWRTDALWWTGGTIRVQCTAMSTGWVTVGTAANPTTFFAYPKGNKAVNYRVLVQMEGIGYSVAAGSYSTTLTFRVN